MLDHKFYVSGGVEQIQKGLRDLKISYEESNNTLLGAIIHNIEQQLWMIDGKNEIFPSQKQSTPDDHTYSPGDRVVFREKYQFTKNDTQPKTIENVFDATHIEGFGHHQQIQLSGFHLIVSGLTI